MDGIKEIFEGAIDIQWQVISIDLLTMSPIIAKSERMLQRILIRMDEVKAYFNMEINK